MEVAEEMAAATHLLRVSAQAPVDQARLNSIKQTLPKIEKPSSLMVRVFCYDIIQVYN